MTETITISTENMQKNLIESDALVNLFQITTEVRNSRRVLIVASGSRGDVQPYIAVGVRLAQRGYDVSVATEQRMKSLVEEYGLTYQFMEGDPTGVLFEPEAQQVLERGGLFKLIKLTEQWDKKYPKETIFNSLLAISKGVEIFIASPLVMTVTYCLAELNKAVWIPIVLGPTYPTMEFPIWPLENLIISSCMNKYSYNLVYKMLWNSEKEMVNTWRTKTLGLKPIGNRRGIADVIDKLAVPVVVASSVLVLKKQRRPLDYPENISFTGFIMVPDAPEESVREDLVEFISDDPMATRLSHITTSSAASALHTTFRINDKSNPIVSATDDNTTSALHTEEEMNDGTVSEGVTIDDLHDEERAKKKVTFGGVFVEIRPIIYLGFGSMPSTKPLALIQLAIDICYALNCRAVIVAGWSDLSSPACENLIAPYVANSTIIIVKSAPHDWLFPKMACIVHHCGIGTMAAALRAGIPQVPCPVMLDQTHNAKDLIRLRVAPGMIPYKKLSYRNLSKMIDKVLSNKKSIRNSASTLGKEIAHECETSLDKCCDIIESSTVPRF